MSYKNSKLGFSLWVCPTFGEIIQQNRKSPSTVLSAHNSTGNRTSMCNKLVKHTFHPFQDEHLKHTDTKLGDSIHIKLTRYWCNWLLSLMLANLSNDDHFSESLQLASKSSRLSFHLCYKLFQMPWDYLAIKPFVKCDLLLVNRVY